MEEIQPRRRAVAPRLFRFDLHGPDGLEAEFLWLCAHCAAAKRMRLGPDLLPVVVPVESASCREKALAVVSSIKPDEPASTRRVGTLADHGETRLNGDSFEPRHGKALVPQLRL